MLNSMEYEIFSLEVLLACKMFRKTKFKCSLKIKELDVSCDFRILNSMEYEIFPLKVLLAFKISR